MEASESEISLLPLGAIIQEFKVDGVNIVQGFPKQEHYVSHNVPFFGETIGRVANRISNAQINSLNGQSYKLLANNGPNALHGGKVGWGKRIWDGPKPVGLRKVPGLPEFTSGGESVQFQLRSEDGDQGYPGEVLATIVYTSGKVNQDGKEATVLAMDYEVELVSGAEETVVNMTNHSYFNLTGGPSIEGTQVQLCTGQHLPVDDGAIPTGKIEAFPGVATDKPFTLGAQDPDIDHCFIVNATASPSDVPLDTRGLSLTRLVSASHPESKIHLEVLSTEPAFQFYTGKFINVPEVAGVPARKARSAFCVEPSRYVNAVNVDEWKSQMLLKKGEKYGARIVYKGWKE